MLIAQATGGGPEIDDELYKQLRAEFLLNSGAKALLPDFVRDCRDLSSFWGYIKYEFGTYADRRNHIWKSFGPLLDYLEARRWAPVDGPAADVLASFDPEGVHSFWERALARIDTEPDGAITLARTMLERVCKRVLDEASITYEESDDLPKLYGKVAKALSLAPSQHTEEAFRRVLGACHTVVETIGTLRNKIGDAHGQGGRPVRPAARHATLVVNLAGSMATFMVETWQARRAAGSDPAKHE